MRPGIHGMTALSLTPESTYTGTVPLTATFDTSIRTPSRVSITIGKSTRLMSRVDGSDEWRATPWDTTKKLALPDIDSPNNFCAWVRVEADIDGRTQSTAFFPVYTGNYAYGDLPDRGWDPALEWAADYSDMTAWTNSFTSPVAGLAYTTLVDDPVRGPTRHAIRASLPDSARFDSDQPTTSPRFQAPQPTTAPWGGLQEGHEFYVGFALYVPTVNSSAPGSGGFPTVDLSQAGRTNKHIAVFQMFGPQARTPTDYPAGRGAITIIDANRTADSDPTDRFHIEANQLNAGDPYPLVEFDYNRGAWTDIVLGFKMSADIRRGWIEVYLNRGQTSTVQPVPLFGGRTRIPRVTAWPETSQPAVPKSYVQGELVEGGSHDHRTDMQIYRAPQTYEEVTLLHTAHRIGPTVGSVDPLSYA